MISKEWFKNNLFTTKGTLNNRVCVDSWWHKRHYTQQLEEVRQTSSYLPDDCLMSERLYHIYHSLSAKPTCECGKHTNFINFKDGYFKYCSKYCATQSKERNEKIVKNRDMAAILEKNKKYNLENYGVEYLFQTKDFVTKAKNTKLERYGDANYCNAEKTKQTNQSRYGVDYTCMADEVIEKIQNKKTESCPQLRDKEWLITQNKTKSITEIANELNVTYRTVYLWYIKHDIDMNFFSPSYSKQQSDITDYIKTLTENVVVNDRTIIKPKEIDIFLPDHNLGIEFNGMYWHSEDPKRHLIKHNICAEKDIDLIQFWDTEWVAKPDIVKSIISTRLGKNSVIYARKCVIKELSSLEYNTFVDENHIQGKVNSSIRIGLFYNEELVSAIGIGRSRFSKMNSHELLRFCNKKFTNVVGGFSKMMRYVDENFEIDSLESFCDIRLFSGELYEQNGFKLSHQTPPGFVYYKTGKVLNRQEMQKHKMAKIVKNFDPTLSEHQNANNNGWLRVWDCGQRLYVRKSG